MTQGIYYASIQSRRHLRGYKTGKVSHSISCPGKSPPVMGGDGCQGRGEKRASAPNQRVERAVLSKT